MRERALKKLKSKSGSSLVLVLVLFLLCVMISSVVVMAAATGASRNASRKTQQQGYLSVISAAKLFAKEMESAGSFVGAETTEDYACNNTLSKKISFSTAYLNAELVYPNTAHTDIDKERSVASTTTLDGAFQDLIKAACAQIYVNKQSSYTSTFTIAAVDERFADVYGTFVMDANYDITVTLKLALDFSGTDDGTGVVADASAYAMTLYYKGATTAHNEAPELICTHDIYYTTEPADGSVGVTAIRYGAELTGRKTIDYTEVTWTRSSVKKGGAE